MAVEENGFRFGQRGIIAIDVTPARLRHGQFRISKVRNGAVKEIRRRKKIGVENGDELAGRSFQALLQRAGLEAFTIVAMDVENWHAQSLLAFNASSRDGFDEALDHVAFVEDGKLYGNLWPLGDGRWRAGDVAAITIKIVDEHVAINSVSGKHREHHEVRNHHGEIERIGLINAAESVVPQPVQIRRKGAGLKGEEQGCDRMKIHFPRALNSDERAR